MIRLIHTRRIVVSVLSRRAFGDHESPQAGKSYALPMARYSFTRRRFSSGSIAPDGVGGWRFEADGEVMSQTTSLALAPDGTVHIGVDDGWTTRHSTVGELHIIRP